MAHGGLHLVDVKCWITIHHELDVLVFRGESLDANILESPVGDGFTHPLKLGASKGLFHEVVVRILPLLHRRRDQLLHSGVYNFVSHLVVFVNQLLKGPLTVPACTRCVLVLDDEECRWFLCEQVENCVEVFIRPVVVGKCFVERTLLRSRRQGWEKSRCLTFLCSVVACL